MAKKLLSTIMLVLIVLFLTTPEIIVTQIQPLLKLIFGNDALQIPGRVCDRIFRNEKLDCFMISWMGRLLMWHITDGIRFNFHGQTILDRKVP